MVRGGISLCGARGVDRARCRERNERGTAFSLTSLVILARAIPSVAAAMHTIAHVALLATVASNVAEMMPRGGGGGGRSRSRSGSGGGGGEVQGDIGPAAERMLMSKTEVQMRRGKGRTLQYLHKALKEAAHSAKPPVHLQPLQPAELKSPEQSQKPKKGSSRRRKNTPLPSL